MRIPTRPIWKRNDRSVVAPRFVCSLPPDSMRLSSNMACFSVPILPLLMLDTGQRVFAPKIVYCWRDAARIGDNPIPLRFYEHGIEIGGVVPFQNWPWRREKRNPQGAVPA